MTNLKNLMFLSGLLAVIHVSLGQVLKSDPCPTNVTAANIEIEQYAGKWYDYAKYPNSYAGSRKCIVFDREVDDDNLIEIRTSEIDSSGEMIGNYGAATMVEPGKFELSFQSMPFFDGYTYSVIIMDESNYAVSYSCRNIESSGEESSEQWLWLMTRERNPDDSVIEEAKKAIEDQGLSLEELQKTDQDDCPED